MHVGRVPARPRLGVALALATAVFVVPIATVQANHSLPDPWLWYWDLGNDGTPDGTPSVDAAGNGWTTAAVDRLTGAISEWAGKTSFDPHYVSTGNFKVYRDGTVTCRPLQPGELALTCVGHTLRPFPAGPASTTKTSRPRVPPLLPTRTFLAL